MRVTADEHRGDRHALVSHLANQGLERSLLDTAVGQHEDVLIPRLNVLERVEGLLDRRHDDRASAGIHAVDRALQVDQVRRRLDRRGPTLGSVELDDADLVVRQETPHGETRDLLGELHAVPSHRA